MEATNHSRNKCSVGMEDSFFLQNSFIHSFLSASIIVDLSEVQRIPQGEKSASALVGSLSSGKPIPIDRWRKSTFCKQTSRSGQSHKTVHGRFLRGSDHWILSTWVSRN